MYQHVQSLCHASFAKESNVVSTHMSGSEQVVDYRLPVSASDFAIQFACPPEIEPGMYLEITARFGRTDAMGVQCVEQAIMGPVRRLPPLDERDAADLDNVPEIGVVFPVPPGGGDVRLSFACAYQPGPLTIDKVRVTVLKAPFGHEHHPRSRVGLIASNEAAVPSLLREMAAHYEHYRSSAMQFSPLWLDEHHPRRTIEILNELKKAPRRGAELAEVR
jgi:hypothetical protein